MSMKIRLKTRVYSIRMKIRLMLLLKIGHNAECIVLGYKLGRKGKCIVLG